MKNYAEMSKRELSRELIELRTKKEKMRMRKDHSITKFAQLDTLIHELEIMYRNDGYVVKTCSHFENKDVCDECRGCAVTPRPIF